MQILDKSIDEDRFLNKETLLKKCISDRLYEEKDLDNYYEVNLFNKPVPVYCNKKTNKMRIEVE